MCVWLQISPRWTREGECDSYHTHFSWKLLWKVAFQILTYQRKKNSSWTNPVYLILNAPYPSTAVLRVTNPSRIQPAKRCYSSCHSPLDSGQWAVCEHPWTVSWNNLLHCFLQLISRDYQLQTGGSLSDLLACSVDAKCGASFHSHIQRY